MHGILIGQEGGHTHVNIYCCICLVRGVAIREVIKKLATHLVCGSFLRAESDNWCRNPGPPTFKRRTKVEVRATIR